MKFTEWLKIQEMGGAGVPFAGQSASGKNHGMTWVGAPGGSLKNAEPLKPRPLSVFGLMQKKMKK